jgi:hypothetical protein
VAELVDAESIAPEDLDAVEGLCVFYDEVLEGLRPLLRDPLLVPPLTLMYLGRSREWVPLRDDDFESLPTRTPDDRAILAQWCKLKKLSWGTPSELRESTVRAADRISVPPVDERLFGIIDFTRLAEYANKAPQSPEHLVVQNFTQAADTAGVRWIAFNPSLARNLGWRLSPDGLFRWTDAEGATMVETLWWQDGSSELGPPHLDEEVGIGWLVVANPKAIDQIRQRLGPLCLIERISRRAKEQGEAVQRDVRSRARLF